MNHVIQRIARDGADRAVAEHGRHLDKLAKIRLRAQHHDALLDGLLRYEEAMRARHAPPPEEVSSEPLES